MNEDLETYESDAEDRFDNFTEDYDDEFYEEEDDFETGLDGMEDDEFYDDDDDFIEEIEYLDDEEYDGFEEDYDDYKSSSIGAIDPNDRTLTMVVTNNSGATATAILFGANQSEAQPAGVVVDVSESSHTEVRNETFSNPFVIKGVKMSVSNPLQFDQVVNLTRRTATGSNSSKVWQPRNSTSPQNLSQNLVDDSQFTAEITPQDSLRFQLLDGVTVVFTFTIKARVNMGNLLKGKNVAELSSTPRTTGLPQLDLMRKKRKSKPRRRVVKRRARRRPAKPNLRRVRRPRRRSTRRRRRR